MAPGVSGNVIRRNLVVGNPPVQVVVDHPTDPTDVKIGLDIKNGADVGTNTFKDNICLTGFNAPCPAVERQQPPQPQSRGKR